jgi:ferredoxin
MDIYEQLRETLDAHPATAPPASSISEILRILFTPEEAAIAARMSFKPKSAAALAEAAGVSETEAEQQLESMADKGVIGCRRKAGNKLYSLSPVIPGVFEVPFMKGERTPMLERLAPLWEEYHHEVMGASFAGNPTPFMRVVAVEASIEARDRIHPYEEVRHLIDGADHLALSNCACRVSAEKCDKPREVCINFNDAALFIEERGFGRRISKEEALAVLDKAEAAGLVHMSNNSADRAGVICNCCPCCCTILRGKTQLNHPHAFEPSRYEARVDGAECIACGLCAEERCPMKAIEIREDAACVSSDNCIGCGLCVTTCPTGAIRLAERESIPLVVATGLELVAKVAQDKGRLEKFMEVLQR